MSTDEQSNSGAGLGAQRRPILAECERRGWQLVEMIEDTCGTTTTRLATVPDRPTLWGA